MELNQKSSFFIGALITSLIGGVSILVDDFAGWYNSGYQVNSWGWIGIESAIENGELFGILLFLGIACMLFYGTVIAGWVFLRPEQPPSLQLIKIAMILAAFVSALGFIGGLIFVIDMLSDEPSEWWFGMAFFGSVIGGALTAFFYYLVLREENVLPF